MSGLTLSSISEAESSTPTLKEDVSSSTSCLPSISTPVSPDEKNPSITSSITSPMSVSSSKELLSPDSSKEPISPLSTVSSLKSPDSTTLLSVNSPGDIPSVGSTTSNASNTSTVPAAKFSVNPAKNSSGVSSTETKQCRICGDKAEIEYYGVMSCDSCRGFFKRAIKNERKYSCIGTRNCVLNKKTRNHCKSCRLTKCYKVGMQQNGKIIVILIIEKM